MTLRVIGAGFGRTGTLSMKGALEHLGLGPCYHMLEVMNRPENADAWYDGQNLVNRVGRDGLDPWLALLNGLTGFQLRLHDWRGEWPCGKLTPDQLTEFLRHYTPGEHQLVVDRRWPVPAEGAVREAALGEEVPGILLAELERLLPMYRYAAWSQESDHLFS